jgi:hypothetical protein
MADLEVAQDQPAMAHHDAQAEDAQAELDTLNAEGASVVSRY